MSVPLRSHRRLASSVFARALVCVCVCGAGSGVYMCPYVQCTQPERHEIRYKNIHNSDTKLGTKTNTKSNTKPGTKNRTEGEISVCHYVWHWFLTIEGCVQRCLQKPKPSRTSCVLSRRTVPNIQFGKQFNCQRRKLPLGASKLLVVVTIEMHAVVCGLLSHLIVIVLTDLIRLMRRHRHEQKRCIAKWSVG